MQYFIINGSSPHSSMWEKSGGDLRPAGYLCPANLIGVSFTKSTIGSPEILEKIKSKLPGIEIPPSTEAGKITGVGVGDHIICICRKVDEKYILSPADIDAGIAIKDYVVVPQQ